MVILSGYSMRVCHFFFFKQKTAYEMRISDWSSDVCSSDLRALVGEADILLSIMPPAAAEAFAEEVAQAMAQCGNRRPCLCGDVRRGHPAARPRSRDQDRKSVV